MLSTTAQDQTAPPERDVGGPLGYEGKVLEISEETAPQEAVRRLSDRLLQAQDAERRRIARELHDSVGQYLAAIEMSLVGALESAPELPPRARDGLADCLTAVRQCSQETRTMSQLLHPPLLDVVGLVVALRDYVTGFSNRSTVKVELHVPEELPRMEAGLETAALRIVQESLMNVYRHSGSNQADWRSRWFARLTFCAAPLSSVTARTWPRNPSWSPRAPRQQRRAAGSGPPRDALPSRTTRWLLGNTVRPAGHPRSCRFALIESVTEQCSFISCLLKDPTTTAGPEASPVGLPV